MKKITGVFLALLFAISLSACGTNAAKDPIAARWEVVSLTLGKTTTSYTGFWKVWGKVKGITFPEFSSDGNTFTLSMSQDNTGIVVKNGDVYELYWDNGSMGSVDMSTATIDGDILTIQMKDNLTIVFKMK